MADSKSHDKEISRDRLAELRTVLLGERDPEFAPPTDLHDRHPGLNEPQQAAVAFAARGRGGIGRHARFRFWWRKPWGFKSLRPHQLAERTDTGTKECRLPKPSPRV